MLSKRRRTVIRNEILKSDADDDEISFLVQHKSKRKHGLCVLIPIREIVDPATNLVEETRCGLVLAKGLRIDVDGMQNASKKNRCLKNPFGQNPNEKVHRYEQFARNQAIKRLLGTTSTTRISSETKKERKKELLFYQSLINGFFPQSFLQSLHQQKPSNVFSPQSFFAFTLHTLPTQTQKRKEKKKASMAPPFCIVISVARNNNTCDFKVPKSCVIRERKLPTLNLQTLKHAFLEGDDGSG